MARETDLMNLMNKLESLENQVRFLSRLENGVIPTVVEIDSVRAYHSADQSMAHNTLVTLALNSEHWDTNAMHNNSTNNSRLTCKTAGIYLIEGQLTITGSTTGQRLIRIDLNGTTILGNLRISATSAGKTKLAVAVQAKLAVNDYVELIGFQNSGISLTAERAADESVEFGMTYLRGTP